MKSIKVQIYQPQSVEREETTKQSSRETNREYNTKRRLSLDLSRFDIKTTRAILPRVIEIPYTFDDTLSSILEKCFFYFGLIKQSDTTSQFGTSFSNTPTNLAQLFDFEHI